jgi:hypothetical protein
MPDQTVASLSKLARSADKADNNLVNSAQGAASPTQVTNIEPFGLSVFYPVAMMSELYEGEPI